MKSYSGIILLLICISIINSGKVFSQKTMDQPTSVEVYKVDTTHTPRMTKPTIFVADSSSHLKAPIPQEVYTTYDEAPVPPGGQQGYTDFLKQNIKYPKDAIDAKVSGTVYISIIIDKTGKLSDVHVEKDNAHHGCAEEAIRVIKMMPPWTPGKFGGKPVTVRYVIPVKFTLP